MTTNATCPQCGKTRTLKSPPRGTVCKSCANQRNGALNATRAGRPTDIDRLMGKVSVAESGCWEWTAGLLLNGYAQFVLNGRNRIAHRAAYELLVGAIPSGMQLDHVCRNRRCVNPEHLEPVTPRENVRRARSAALITGVRP